MFVRSNLTNMVEESIHVERNQHEKEFHQWGRR
jgi:hypothetical protein